MSIKKRSTYRRKKLKLIYFGSDLSQMENKNLTFWKDASEDAKHQAMRSFVADEVERLGMKEYGPKLLRLTSTFRKA